MADLDSDPVSAKRTPMKKYQVSKDGKVYAVVDEPYPADVVRGMKKAGYKVKEIEVKAEKKPKTSGSA